MQFELSQAKAVLERTPDSLHALLSGLPQEWTTANEGEGTWSPYQVVAHLLYCERHNWLLRVRQMVEADSVPTFAPLDREGGFTLYDRLSLEELLERFRETRKEVLEELDALNIGVDQYDAKTIHPAFGEVKLSELLSTWVVHDLSHMGQIIRVLAGQYKDSVGPWVEYLRVLK